MPDESPQLVVALDGPASSGKSTVGARAATELGYRFVDTGLLYRGVTWLSRSLGLAPDEADAIAAIVPRVELRAGDDGRYERVVVDGRDVTDEVLGPDVDRAVSDVARQPQVRGALFGRQRRLAEAGGIVVAGRDIGTVVLPDADVKVFLDASPEERARRRAEQRGLDPAGAEAAAILADLRARDAIDRNRETAPLRAADDAVVIHTDGNRIEDTVEAVVAAVRQAQARHLDDAIPVERAKRSTAPHSLDDQITPFIRLSDWFGRTVMACLTRVHVEGLDEPLDIRGPLIIASNHASNADGILVACWVGPALGRRINWLGKQEALEWPVLGAAIAANGVFGVRRDAADLEAFRAAKRVLDAGHVLGVFPEGTRSPDGVIREPKDGAAMLALRTGAPILPVGISGTHRFWPRGRGPRIGKPVRMRVGRPFTLPAGTGGDRRAAQAAATRLIMTRIAELVAPSQRGAYRADVERRQGN